MIKYVAKFTLTAAAALLFFAGAGFDVQAAGSVLPSGGVDVAIVKGTSLDNLVSTADTSVLIETLVEQVETEVVEEVEEDESLAWYEKVDYTELVISQANNYVNVRSTPDESGEVLGKLYSNAVGLYLGEEDGWYLIGSGSITGYVKAEYCVTGEEAAQLAEEVCTRIATVTTTTLKVRKEATTESSVIGLVPIEDELIVTEEVEGWVKVDVEEGEGWVSTDYVTLRTEFEEAESIEEEKARLAKEEAARKKAQAAASSTSSSSSSKSGTTYTVSGSGSEMGIAVAQYALQFVGNPYVYGGTSLTNGTDCSGFVMSVYAAFGVTLPHSSSSDRSQGYAVEGGLANAQPGDIICYSGHVGIYIGNGQIVHASNSKTGIIVSDANYRTVLAVRRIF